MAVVPDRRITFLDRINALKANRHYVSEALENLRLKRTNENDQHSISSSKGPNSNVSQGKYSKQSPPHNEALNNDSSDTSRCVKRAPLSPMSTSSTDTSSEVGSNFNPSECDLNSTQTKVTNFFVFKMVPEENGTTCKNEPSVPNDVASNILTSYGIQDLDRLKNTLEEQISSSEQSLLDELEKREKYRIEDSRRTHNYDEFINTFLLMLADQKMLPDLISEAKRNPADAPNDNDNADDSRSPGAFLTEVANLFNDIKKRDRIRTARRNARSSRKKKKKSLNYRAANKQRSK